MKRTKNALLLFAGGLVLLIAVAVSCKKNSSSTGSAPTITSVSQSSTNPGDTITISGTNLSSATSVKVNGTTATILTNSATSITAVVGAGTTSGTVTVVTPGGTATSSTSVTIGTAPSKFSIASGIDAGDTSSSQIAKTFLKAYWPFDNSSNTEAISGVSGTVIHGGPSANGTASYTTGQVGGAISFTDGGLIYNPIPNLDSINQLQRYTISMWVNMPPNNVAEYPAGSPGQESSLFEVNGDWFNDIWGLVAVEVKTNAGYTGDTLGLSAELTQIDGTAPYVHTDDNTAVLNPRTTPSQFFGGANKWSFITETYDDATDSVHIYGNGQLLLGVQLGILLNPGETFTLNPNFGTVTPYAHNQVTFGSFMFGDEFGASNSFAAPAPFGHPALAATKPYWTHGINAMLDEVRVYNTVLSPGEIMDLYQLGFHNQ